MGTETKTIKGVNKMDTQYIVKLNNPLMGTETNEALLLKVLQFQVC